MRLDAGSCLLLPEILKLVVIVEFYAAWQMVFVQQLQEKNLLKRMSWFRSLRLQLCYLNVAKVTSLMVA